MAKLKMTNKEVLKMVKDYYRLKFMSGECRVKVKVIKLTDIIPEIPGEKFLRSVKNPDLIICGVLEHIPDVINATHDEIIEEQYIVQHIAFNESKKEIIGELWMESVKEENLDLY